MGAGAPQSGKGGGQRIAPPSTQAGKGGGNPYVPRTEQNLGPDDRPIGMVDPRAVQDTYTEAVNAVPTVAPVSKRPDPIMPTVMGQTTPTPQEPTITPSQLVGAVQQSMGGKGGYRAPSFNPYASQGGFGYQPMSGGKGGYSQPAPNPYAAQGGKGGYRAPTYNPYATQSPYVNYNQPSYNPAPAPSMGGKGSTQPQQPMTSGGKGGSMGGKGGTAGGKGG